MGLFTKLFGEKSTDGRLNQSTNQVVKVVSTANPRPGTPGQLSAEERQAVSEGKIVLAIKLYRERTGASLKESKAVIDSFRSGKTA